MTSAEKRFNKIIATKIISSCNDLHIRTEFFHNCKPDEFIVIIKDALIISFNNRDKLMMYKIPRDVKIGWKSNYLLECEKTEENAESLPYELKALKLI